MDFEKEAREIAEQVRRNQGLGMNESARYGIESALRRAFNAGEESMRERAAYVVEAWDADDDLTPLDVCIRDIEISDSIRSLPATDMQGDK